MKKRRSKRSLKTITIMLAIITSAVWLILLLAKSIATGIVWSALLDDILSNILGILPPIILFNFLYEYLTKEHVADDMTESITKTLMSNPETIDLFDENAKKGFVKATVQTLVGNQEDDMVYGVIEPYLDMAYNIRRFFRYNIILRDHVGDPFFPSDRYMRVCEDLKYKKQFVGDNCLAQRFHLGFFVNNEELDKELRGQNYLFRENLHIDRAELTKLIQCGEEEKVDYIVRMMALKVFVDGEAAQMEKVCIDENGISVDMFSSHDEASRELKIEIMFNMPQRKGYSEFLVSLNEPTFSPMIQLSFPEDTMQVTMFPFLNNGEDSLIQNAMRHAGCCDIYMQDAWVYPMSGVVFIVRPTEREEK